jgi:glutaredoxin
VKAIALAILMMAVAGGAGAQMYRWTDKDGKVHFSDSPPPAGARNVTKKGVAVQGSAAAPAPNVPFATQQAMKDSPVTLYSTPGCEACDLARKLLNARGVPFKEVSVNSEKDLAQLQSAVGSNSVPSMVVGPSVLKGFEEGAYHRALDSAGYPKAGIVPPRAQAEPKAGNVPESKPAPTPPAEKKKSRYYSGE